MRVNIFEQLQRYYLLLVTISYCENKLDVQNALSHGREHITCRKASI